MKSALLMKRHARARTRLSFDALEQRAMLAADLNFTPLDASAVVGPVNVSQAVQNTPYILGTPYTQTPVARHTSPDALPPSGVGQNTLNESGTHIGRYLFTTSALSNDPDSPYSSVTRTDLISGEKVDLLSIATADGQDPDLPLDSALSIQNLNAIRWTPWGTLLVAESISGDDDGYIPDPDFPDAMNGLVYEITDPLGDNPVIFARPALGSGAFQGIAIDSEFNIYYDDLNGTLGAILRFTPTDFGDPLSDGMIDVLLEDPAGTSWQPLVGGPSDLHTAVGDPVINYTAYGAPKDIEFTNSVLGPTIYVALQGEQRVISIDLDGDADNFPFDEVVVSTYADTNTLNAATGTNVDLEFDFPSDLAVDRAGRVYIGEQIPDLITGESGNDIWVGVDLDDDGVADELGRLGSLRINGAVVNGLYVNPFNNSQIYVNVADSASGRDGIFLLTGPAQSAQIFEIDNGGEVTLVVVGTQFSESISVTGTNILTITIGGKRYGGWAPTNNVIIYAQGGNDRVIVAASTAFNFSIYGGTGNDYLYGGRWDDLLAGEAGNDNLLTGNGENVAIGGDGNDVISGGAGNDLIQGNAGNDRLLGAGGDDVIDGGDGNDQINGGAGNDLLQGGAGNDKINGYFGDDIILGNAGNDVLHGGMGVDLLFGGLGADNLFSTNGDSLLFGEALSFEDDAVRLYELLAEWYFVATSDDRADYMTPLLEPITSDGMKDVLTGGAGVDLFYIFVGKDVAQSVRSGDVVVTL